MLSKNIIKSYIMNKLHAQSEGGVELLILRYSHNCS